MKSTTVPIHEYIKSKTELIEVRLDQLILEKNVPYINLFRAARYSLLSGGKRLRPLLTLATAEALGAESTLALDPACALEMIHTYSLIHDDLPCMDDDDFRRGKPSLHKAFPESHAVLAGDFLLTEAFNVVAQAKGLTAEQKIELVHLLSLNSGAEGMIGGQLMDIEAEGQSIDLKSLREIHKRKTGALLAACIECGGVIAKASSSDMQILKEFGEGIGIAFQIIDDILDVTTHKNSDAKNLKVTYATLMNLDKAQELAYISYQSANEKLKKLPYDCSLLLLLADLLVFRNK